MAKNYVSLAHDNQTRSKHPELGFFVCYLPPAAQSDLASERLVLETEHFVVSAPFACRERWRLYLAPKRHSPEAWHATKVIN